MPQWTYIGFRFIAQYYSDLGQGGLA